MVVFCSQQLIIFSQQSEDWKQIRPHLTAIFDFEPLWNMPNSMSCSSNVMCCNGTYTYYSRKLTRKLCVRKRKSSWNGGERVAQLSMDSVLYVHVWLWLEKENSMTNINLASNRIDFSKLPAAECITSSRVFPLFPNFSNNIQLQRHCRFYGYGWM